jgi:deoxyribodipyrimidine photo-lyase
MSVSNGPAIMWFRRDLRLGDHPALHEAVKLGGEAGVVGVFVLDDALLAPSGKPRAQFLAGCLDALNDSMDGHLVILKGDPTIVIPDLAQGLNAPAVVVSADFGPYGQRRDSGVEAILGLDRIAFERVGSSYAVDPGTVLSEKGAPLKVFTAFRRRWELLGPHIVLPVPEVSWVDFPSMATTSQIVEDAGRSRPARFEGLAHDATPGSFQPGEAAALDRLNEFAGAKALHYRAMRDMMAEPGTSGLSPYLRFGCIHPRTALNAVAGDDEGSVTFRSEIAWREFYADVLFHEPRSARETLQPSLRSLRWDSGPIAVEHFQAWARGETGIPLVDAGMRQLLAEGWMHNRTRMICASFLVKHLHIDWRWGARWFMDRLIDGDLASNSHGWQWTAGTGTDAAPFHRIFSPIAQAERFDVAGSYIRRYVTELASVEPPQLYQPGGGSGLLRPEAYPEAIVELKAEREEALARFAEARGKS